MKKEQRGDWPVPLTVLTEKEARKLGHDTPPPPSRADDAKLRTQEDEERRAGGHPSQKHRLDDPDLD